MEIVMDILVIFDTLFIILAIVNGFKEDNPTHKVDQTKAKLEQITDQSIKAMYEESLRYRQELLESLLRQAETPVQRGENK